MFWDRVACVYDLFVNGINRETHNKLREIVADLIRPEDEVLECACGTGMLSMVIAARCRTLTATDFSTKMLERAKKNCRTFGNITFEPANITALPFPDATFDRVVAANVIHLLDDPMQALRELNRVCKEGGQLIIPTYMNRDRRGRTGHFVSAVDSAGAGFRRQFTVNSYGDFFREAGYTDVTVTLATGRIPCAVAVMTRTSRA
ncbi:MAG: methyltransferase domain-containing protein [Clostridia bacterium]|nr:methyltransferase domain-containing protein [Clostridia bacterium]